MKAPRANVYRALIVETADPAMGGEMTITISLVDADAGTDVVAVHDRLPPGLSLADNSQIWSNGTGASQ